MGNHELRRKETVESQSEKNNSSKSQESSSTIYDRAKNSVGIAFAGALKAAEVALKVTTAGLAVRGVSGLDGAHALSQSNESTTALARRNGGSRDGNNATALHLDQKGLPYPSNQTNLERSLRKVTPELLEHLGKFVNNPEQFIQNAQQQRDLDIQKQVQRQKMRQLAEKAQEDPKVLESLRKLPEQKNSKQDRKKPLTSDEKIATLKAVAKEASKDPKIAASVRRMLAERRLQSIAETPQGSIAEAPQGSAEAPQKSSEKDTVGPVPICLQDSFPASYVRAAPTEVAEGGQALQVILDLGTTNICSDSISSVQFAGQDAYTCPDGCTYQSHQEIWEEAIKGDPSTIAQHATSKGSDVKFISCVDAKTKEAVLPTSLTILTQPQGVLNGGRTGGVVDEFEWPSS